MMPVIDSYFEDKFHTIMKSVPQNWDIVLLSFWLHKGDNGEKVNANITRFKDFVFMNAYVIDAKGAKNCAIVLQLICLLIHGF